MSHGQQPFNECVKLRPEERWLSSWKQLFGAIRKTFPSGCFERDVNGFKVIRSSWLMSAGVLFCLKGIKVYGRGTG